MTGFASFLVLSVVFAWLYLSDFPVTEDLNPESMDIPLAVACLNQAHNQGLSPADFFETNPVMRNIREQNPKSAFGFFDRFFLSSCITYVPLLAVFFHPFIRLFGVSVAAVEAYSIFFAALAVIVSAMLAQRMFGRGHAVLTTLAIFSGLTWLIAIKVGSPQPLPSIALMALLIFTLYEHSRTGHPGWLVACGCLLGLTCLVGWIVFAFGLLAIILAIPLVTARSFGATCARAGVLLLAAALTVVSGVALYAWFDHLGMMEIYRGLSIMYFGRLQQGEPSINNLTWAERMLYTCKCLFVDSQTSDGHVDKYLEGQPAIPWIFTALFLVGLLYSIKNRTLGDKILLIWLVAVFVPLGTFFTFAHRYALLGLPAMAILAARGGVHLYYDLLFSGRKVAARIFAVLLAFGFALSIFATHEEYYVDYRQHKPPNFEIDRFRGHAKLAAWLKAHASPDDTLVVLGDPVMFSHISFIYATFAHPYPFAFWSNYFAGHSDSEEVAQWERVLLKQYHRIVYVFSTQLISHPFCRFENNDWKAFLASHPGIQPLWSYSYSERPPSMLLFMVSRYPDESGPIGSSVRSSDVPQVLPSKK